MVKLPNQWWLLLRAGWKADWRVELKHMGKWLHKASMPYRFVKTGAAAVCPYDDLDKHRTTIEEREEYEPLMRNSHFAGDNYEAILRGWGRQMLFSGWSPTMRAFFKPDPDNQQWTASSDAWTAVFPRRSESPGGCYAINKIDLLILRILKPCEQCVPVQSRKLLCRRKHLYRTESSVESVFWS